MYVGSGGGGGSGGSSGNGDGQVRVKCTITFLSGSLMASFVTKTCHILSLSLCCVFVFVS